jgi:hypothetical protein
LTPPVSSERGVAKSEALIVPGIKQILGNFFENTENKLHTPQP